MSKSRIAVDPLFPGSENLVRRFPVCDILSEIKFSLIFDDKVDAAQIPIIKENIMDEDIADTKDYL